MGRGGQQDPLQEGSHTSDGRPLAPIEHFFKFETLEELVNTGQLDVLVRSVPMHKEYRTFRNEHVKEWRTMTDSLRHRVFGREPKVDPHTGLKYTDPIPPEEPIKYALLPNDFPYAVDKGIEHYVFWASQNISDFSIIDQYVKEKFNKRRYIYFENPVELKSVLDLWHAHVFIDAPK
eukprot:Clim_evm99s128 gene=Clim_evmTU99s128